jgi:cellulose synthase/poly-beta-1,6-N-acetylglucosamine synthase-like glycosyltransferase
VRERSFGIAIPVSNEAQNIERLLERAAASGPARILVVSDGSRDGTDALVRAAAASSSVPITLLTQSERRGKADAVNRILSAMADLGIVVMISGDALPAPGCIERLVAAFDDPAAGVAAARPVPEGPSGNPAVAVSRLLWSLHHRIALAKPKSAEITAFRNVLDRIDPAARADEAAIEAAVAARGFHVVYVPEAVVHTHSPLTLRDYVRQRTRVTVGHLSLANQYGYRVGTLSWRHRLGAIRDVRRDEGVRAVTLGLAALLEAAVYSAAWIRMRFAPPRGGAWARIQTTKRTFVAE